MTASPICCNHDCRQGRDCPLRVGMTPTRQLLEDLRHPEVRTPKMTKKPKKYMRPAREMPKIDMAFLLRRCTQAPAEDGGCLIWNRQMKNGPITNIDGRVWKVRHLVWITAHQRKSKSTHIPMPTVCQDERCVHIDHLTLVKRNSHQVGKKLPLLQRMHIAQVKRATSAKLDEERAHNIRTSNETLRALAQSNGIALSLAQRIKTGQSWLNYRNPFLQLAT
jgi:hypothetical protein